MAGSRDAEVAARPPDLHARLYAFAARAAALPDVRAVVEANHDDNRWWPRSVLDWRVRMLVAGWSARVSYAMIGTYAGVVARADTLGWDSLTAMGDEPLARLVHPLGLPAARIRYLRSLATFVTTAHASGTELRAAAPDELIESFTASVSGAGYNTAQCAVLYAHGYHCGIIPVDSGMVTKLAPMLGIGVGTGPAAQERLRRLLEPCVTASPDAYRDLASCLGYQITVPPGVPPTWFVHLVLIYFKRLYLNRPRAGLCPRRPVCQQLLGCTCEPEE
jgi:endonuclease III